MDTKEVMAPCTARQGILAPPLLSKSSNNLSASSGSITILPGASPPWQPPHVIVEEGSQGTNLERCCWRSSHSPQAHFHHSTHSQLPGSLEMLRSEGWRIRHRGGGHLKMPKSHPVAYFSWKLTPTERNHNVGDHELLAIKLALEEWYHWLEGALYPTDHKYLWTAKRLNPPQARCNWQTLSMWLVVIF